MTTVAEHKREGGEAPVVAPSSLAALRSMMDSEPSLATKWANGWDEGGSVTLDDDGNVVALDLGGRRLKKLAGSNFEALGSLLSLNLGGTDLPVGHIKGIVSSLHGLHHLYLGANGIGDKGVTDLADVLPSVPALKTLDLRYNDIGPDGCAALADGVSSHQNINFLHLEGNQLRDDGAATLGAAVSSSTNSIRELYLGDNKIESAGAVKLADAVGANISLVKLYLEGNNIGPEGAAAFSAQLEMLNGKGDAAVLKNLFVDNNNIGKESMKRLASALNSNTCVDETPE